MPAIVLPSPHDTHQDSQSRPPSSTPNVTSGDNQTIVGAVSVILRSLPAPYAAYQELGHPSQDAPRHSRGPQVDGKVTKILNRSIYNLACRVSATRRAFDAVVSNITELGGDFASRKVLEDLWGEIRQQFEHKLRLSKDVAIRGGNAIKDFLKVVIPYISGREHAIEEKIKYLKEYLTTLQTSNEQASKVSDSFNDIHLEIMRFQAQCNEHNDGTKRELDSAIADLEKEIRGLTESLQEVTSSLSQLKPMWHKPNKFEGRDRDGTSVSKKEFSSPSARPKKLIKQELNELRRERREVVHLENAIEKHTDTLSAHMKSFCAIWSLVDTDVVNITTQLEYVTSSAIPKMFYRRMSRLPRQYAGLRTALQNYAIALSDDRLASRSIFSFWG